MWQQKSCITCLKVYYIKQKKLQKSFSLSFDCKLNKTSFNQKD